MISVDYRSSHKARRHGGRNSVRARNILDWTPALRVLAVLPARAP